MSHFNRKTATFYGIAIGSVLILFNIITAYGEANLKASPTIGGSYKLEIVPQANCSNPEKLLLLIEQSGVYLGATLLPNKSSQALVEYPKFFPLSGKWNQEKIKLAGTIANLNICNSEQKNPPTTVQIKAELTDKNLQGQITLNSQAESLKFTAFNSLDK
jgi:hypothetical protein